MNARRVYAVVPAFGEAAVIARVVAELRPFADKVVVVDDGSPDATAEVAEAAGASTLRHALNRGQGAALATGIRYALLDGADVIVTFDADGQHSAEDLPELVKPVLEGRADVALGSRFLGSSEVPPLRRLLLGAAVVFTRLSTGLRLSDTHNGLRALSRQAAERIRLRQDRMAHASEILAEIGRLRLRIVEVPVRIRYTEYSRSKGQSSLDALRVLLDLWLGGGAR